MPIVIPVEVQVPPTLQITPEMISAALSKYAQGYVDGLASSQGLLQATMTQEDIDNNYLSLDEFETRLHARVDAFYDNEVCA